MEVQYLRRFPLLFYRFALKMGKCARIDILMPQSHFTIIIRNAFIGVPWRRETYLNLLLAQ